jgi:iron complex transport system substrate-binding protein
LLQQTVYGELDGGNRHHLLWMTGFVADRGWTVRTGDDHAKLAIPRFCFFAMPIGLALGCASASGSAYAQTGPVKVGAGLALAGLAWGLAAAASGDEQNSGQLPVAYQPVTVQVCDAPVRFDAPPSRAVTHDVNITEMFLALDLGHRMAGYSGIRSSKTVAPEYRAQLEKLPLLSDKGLNLETLVGAGADFVFGGWGYGFQPGEVTPEALARFGIQSYILGESCVRVGARRKVSLEDTFNDLLNLGRIFRVEARARAWVDRQRTELAKIGAALCDVKTRPRVFVYDSDEAIPLTTGRFAMPHAMIELAGGENIFADLSNSWMRANWEDVIHRDPEWIVIIDYGQPNAAGKIGFLLARQDLAQVTAIRERRFVVLDYAAATPGPRNVESVRALAEALHPEAMIRRKVKTYFSPETYSLQKRQNVVSPFLEKSSGKTDR